MIDTAPKCFMQHMEVDQRTADKGAQRLFFYNLVN